MYRILLQPLLTEVPSVVTIGNFDGLHRGHWQLINEVNRVGSEFNLRRILVTFEPLTSEFFAQQRQIALPRLSLLRDKYRLLKAHNLIDELVILRFNQNFRHLNADEFIANILLAQLKMQHFVAGSDFRFAYQALGGIETFTQERYRKLTVTVVPKYYHNNQIISSTLLRNLAADNNLQLLTEFLGHHLTYTARIKRGKQLGSKILAIPTINLDVGAKALAIWGIYFAYVYINDVRYQAVVSSGKNPTVSTTSDFKLEAYLLDVNLDLYNKIATIEILHFWRREKKFNNLIELKDAIVNDIAAARQFFKQNCMDER